MLAIVFISARPVSDTYAAQAAFKTVGLEDPRHSGGNGNGGYKRRRGAVH